MNLILKYFFPKKEKRKNSTKIELNRQIVDYFYMKLGIKFEECWYSNDLDKFNMFKKDCNNNNLIYYYSISVEEFIRIMNEFENTRYVLFEKTYTYKLNEK